MNLNFKVAFSTCAWTSNEVKSALRPRGWHVPGMSRDETHFLLLPLFVPIVTRLAGVKFMLHLQACQIIKSDSKKPQHWNVAARADNERKRTLTAKMHHASAIFSVYMPSEHTMSSNITPGPRAHKFACKCEPFFNHGWEGYLTYLGSPTSM